MELIPSANPKLRFDTFHDEIVTVTDKVLSAGNYILGEEVSKFEKAFAAYIGTTYCIAVNSGTDAISLSLLAVGIKPGDEVITTSISAPATVIAILNIGAMPVIVDVAAPTYCIAPSQVQIAITPKTKAIVPVHLHGYAAAMDELLTLARANNLIIVEDCAQSVGALHNGIRLGAIGQYGAFSFYPTKNLGCIGDGGAITTNDPKVAEKLYSLRNYGLASGKVKSIGMNSRMDELQAAILNVQLADLDKYNERRAFYAKAYDVRLKEFDQVLPPIVDGAVYHQYPIRVKNRDEFRKQLLDLGIMSGVHYDATMKDHPVFEQYCKAIPVASEVVEQFVSIPIQPEILDVHFERIVTTLSTLL